MSDWVEATDPDSGATYYHNTASGETSWEVPEGFTPSEKQTPHREDGDASKWTEAVDPDSGATYYVNSETQETSWEVPPGYKKPEGGDEAAADAPAAAAPAAAASGEADDAWVAVKDESSGSTYYHNTVTDATSWDVPPTYKPPTEESGEAAAPAPAAPAPKVLSAESKRLWLLVVNHVKLQASTKINENNKKFSQLKNFAKRTLDRKVTPAATTDEPAAGAGEPAEGGKTVWDFLTVELDKDFTRVDIEEYATNYFNLNRKGFLGKKTTVEKILSWKSDVIKMALKKMPSKDLNSQATQCFRNITGFMGDRSSKKEDGGHAEKLLKACLTAPEELRDEVYCQLIKQTTKNGKTLIKGWQLMGICTGAFPPSKTFEPYLMSYCDSHKKGLHGVGKHATFCAGRVKMAIKLGPRREVPTAMEIDSCKAMMPVAMRVYHLDGRFETMPVVSWTTASHMNEMMAFKLGIKNPEAFACYEITPEGEERYLEPDERLLDMVAYWQRLFEEEKTKEKGDKTSIINMYRVAYKVHMYFEPEETDKAAQDQMYVQTVYDVVSSRYPCSEEDCIELGALQLQAEYGDAGLGGLDEERKLKRFLPVKYATSDRSEELAADLIKAHEAHRGKPQDDVKAAYMAKVKAWKIFGSSFFYVEPQMSVDLPDEVFLAVNPKGVLIINPDTKEVLVEHPYSEVPTWGHSGSSFVLHVGNLIRQTKLYFQTEQGKEINDLVRAYVNHLCM